jgi:hypothetical protein
MRQVTFAMQLTGKRVRWPGGFRRKASGSAQTSRTRLTEDGIESSMMAEDGGGTVLLESTIQTVLGHGMPAEGEGTYLETGTVTYGTLGKVQFKSVGQTVLGPVVDGIQRGAAIWQVLDGDGKFEGVGGWITVNFALAASGEQQEHHCSQFVWRM